MLPSAVNQKNFNCATLGLHRFSDGVSYTMQQTTNKGREVPSGEYAKHLRPFGKRVAAGNSRRHAKAVIRRQVKEAAE